MVRDEKMYIGSKDLVILDISGEQPQIINLPEKFGSADWDF